MLTHVTLSERTLIGYSTTDVCFGRALRVQEETVHKSDLTRGNWSFYTDLHIVRREWEVGDFPPSFWKDRSGQGLCKVVPYPYKELFRELLPLKWGPRGGQASIGCVDFQIRIIGS
jgi:hypothetical protein